MSRRRLSQQQLRRIRETQANRRDRSGPQNPGSEIDDVSQLGPAMAGLVIANFGPTLIVEDQTGTLHRCALRQNLTTAVSGDRVVWQAIAPGEGVVTALEARHSLLSRPDYSGRLKPVAANLDRVAVVFASEPPINEFLIDRYLVAIHAMGVRGILVLNKVDLLADDQLGHLEERLEPYRRIGYPLVSTSTKQAGGRDELSALLRGGTTILVGQSGVGKSSLIKSLLPDREIRVQALSEATGKGTHTTTTSTLYHLPGGGDLIDSPGVRSFELMDISLEQLEGGFPELNTHRQHCRFANCSHGAEPGCAVQDAVRRGEMDERRLASYQQLRTAIGA